ncbi:MAG: single-stranded DNA-binding protein [Candidatus Sericytochromatia bacterium]|nr:single-stranded DNA-binding protein [Candidatus Sericytochromatia bacterium]
MAANNTIMVIGRVGKDPETRTIASGRTVAKFSIAVRRPGKDAKGQEITDWFSVDLWGKQAELAGDLIRKGALISVAGACNIDEWTDQAGLRQKMVKIAAESFQLLEAKGAENQHGGQQGGGYSQQGGGYDQAPAHREREPVGAGQPAAAPAPRYNSAANRDGAAMASGKDADFFDEDDIPPF